MSIASFHYKPNPNPNPNYNPIPNPNYNLTLTLTLQIFEHTAFVVKNSHLSVNITVLKLVFVLYALDDKCNLLKCGR